MKQKSENKPFWKQTYVIVGLVAILVTIIACVTFAFFVDDGEEKAPVSFGIIEIDKERSFFRGSSVDNVLPGARMVDEITFKKSSRSRDYYARAKIEFSIPETTIYQFVDVVDTLNATISEATYACSDYMWKKADDGYYYLIDPSGAEIMYKVTTTDAIYFTEGVRYPTTAEQVFSSNDTSNNSILQAGAQIEVAFTLEVIQADNHETGEISTLSTIKDVFPTVTKSFNFKYMEGVDAPKVDTTTLNVGDPLPVVTKTNYQIVWFNHEDAINEPFVAQSVKIRPGLTYYGMWFYTGKTGYNFAGSSITGYTGSEENLILPTTTTSSTTILSLSSLGSTNVKRVVIPEGYKSIGGQAFASAPLLNILTLPSSLTSIGARLFGSGLEGYSNVQYLTVPASVTTIGEYAFNTSSLCQIKFLGANVTISGALIPQQMNSYFEILVPDIAHYKTSHWRNYNIVSGTQCRRIYEDGVFYARKAEEEVYTAYAANRNLADVVIKAQIEVDNTFINVETVDNCFNSYNNNFKTLVVGDNVKLIRSICKADRNLKSVHFGMLVNKMEAFALDGLTSLTTLVFTGRVPLDNGVTGYNENAITSSCNAISEIYVPSAARSHYVTLFSRSAITSNYTIKTGLPA